MNQKQDLLTMNTNMKDYSNDIINLVKNEKQNYQDASQDIREEIKKARQNYSCKFDNPYTTQGRLKMFVPLTRWEVDATTSKVFVNDKALTIIPRNEESVNSALIAEKVLKYQIGTTRFPMYFKNSMYDLNIDGTTVWASYWDFEREVEELPKKGFVKKMVDGVKKMVGKEVEDDMPKVNVLRDKLCFKQIDILNCFIDPTADSIQDAPSFIIRNVMPLDEAKKNKLYKNTEELAGYTTEKFDTYDGRSTRKYDIGQEYISYEQPMVGIYERWGRFPKSWLTGNEKDEKYMIDGVISIGDMDDGKSIILRVEKNPYKHGKKPFEECWFQKKGGLWYGLSPAMKLIELQSWMNKTINRRQENEDILHAGLFKIRRGSGLSAKSIVAKPGSIIEVDNMADLEQLQVRDISQFSNTTIDLIRGFVERVNGANEVSLGGAADRSATTSLIKDRNADTRFAAVRGYVNDFLIRFFSQWIDLNKQYIDQEFVIRVTGEDEEMNQIDDVLGNPMEVREKLPNYRFIKVDPESIRGEFDIEADIDQSMPMNKAENAERIIKVVDVVQRYQIPGIDTSKLIQEYLKFSGLQGSKYQSRPQPQPMMQQNPNQPQMNQSVPNEVQQFQQANNPGLEGMSTTEIMQQAK